MSIGRFPTPVVSVSGSTTNDHIAVWNGNNNGSLKDGGTVASAVAAAGGVTSQTVADQTARLALTGLVNGSVVKQTDNGFFYTLINAAAPSSAASWLVTPKVYSCLLAQESTSAPTADVLQNTLGGTVVWTRDNVGSYLATLANAFTADRTFLISSWCDNQLAVNAEVRSILGWTSVNIIHLSITDDTSSGVNDLGRAYIEIRVYP